MVEIMIIPSGVDIKNNSEEQLIVAFRRAGYSAGTSKYLAKKIKGKIVDDNIIQ